MPAAACDEQVMAIDDLDSLNTLGFRGEALPSIARSRFSIRTREPGTLGAIPSSAAGAARTCENRCRWTGWNRDCRGPILQWPARRKFLKTQATEASHVQELVQRIALCYPEVAVRFVKDGRQAQDYPAASGAARTDRSSLWSAHGGRPDSRSCSRRIWLGRFCGPSGRCEEYATSLSCVHQRSFS